MKHLPAVLTPGGRLGAGLDETIGYWQKVVDEQRMADPVVRSSQGQDVRV